MKLQLQLQLKWIKFYGRCDAIVAWNIIMNEIMFNTYDNLVQVDGNYDGNFLTGIMMKCPCRCPEWMLAETAGSPEHNKVSETLKIRVKPVNKCCR